MKGRGFLRRRRRVDPTVRITFRYNILPVALIWRGRRRPVLAVERRWTVRKGWRHPRTRRYLQLRCPDGRYVVYQDLESRIWHLERVDPF